MSVAGAAAGLLLLLLLLKKRRDKKKKQGDQVPMTNDAERTYAGIPTGKYSNFNTTNESVTTATEEDGIAVPTSIKPSEIDQRMHIPYKSLVFVKEIGAGSYGKVYLG